MFRIYRLDCVVGVNVIKKDSNGVNNY